MEKSKAFRTGYLILVLSLILIAGFLATSLVSYFVSLSTLRNQITSNALPLTSDNIYSEIQRDLLKPIFISSLMANDTFLRDWVINGEEDEKKIRNYLKTIKTKYNTFTTFFVSDLTDIYYHADGVLKEINPKEPRDKWYFRVKNMKPDYEINVDPDMANEDTMTIFINHRVYDYEGKYIGATGVGLKVSALIDLIKDYGLKYHRNIYFADQKGDIVLSNNSAEPNASIEKNNRNILTTEGISIIAEDILSKKMGTYKYSLNGNTFHLNSRFVPALKWYLLVEQTETEETENIYRALIINLLLCALITLIVIILIILTVNAYRKINKHQQTEIDKQQEVLIEKNSEIEEALTEVKHLSGLLPICASCKKIRNDEGYWQRIESYIMEHSEADFSHGICPDCVQKLYGEYLNKNDKNKNQETK